MQVFPRNKVEYASEPTLSYSQMSSEEGIYVSASTPEQSYFVVIGSEPPVILWCPCRAGVVFSIDPADDSWKDQQFFKVNKKLCFEVVDA